MSKKSNSSRSKCLVCHQFIPSGKEYCSFHKKKLGVVDSDDMPVARKNFETNYGVRFCEGKENLFGQEYACETDKFSIDKNYDE